MWHLLQSNLLIMINNNEYRACISLSLKPEPHSLALLGANMRFKSLPDRWSHLRDARRAIKARQDLLAERSFRDRRSGRPMQSEERMQFSFEHPTTCLLSQPAPAALPTSSFEDYSGTRAGCRTRPGVYLDASSLRAQDGHGKAPSARTVSAGKEDPQSPLKNHSGDPDSQRKQAEEPLEAHKASLDQAETEGRQEAVKV